MSRLNLPDIVERAQTEPLRLWICPQCRKVRATVTTITAMNCLDCNMGEARVPMLMGAYVMSPPFLRQYAETAGTRRILDARKKN